MKPHRLPPAELTPAQQVAVCGLDIPPFLQISAADRAKAWEGRALTPTSTFVPARPLTPEVQQFKQEQEQKKKARLSKLSAPRVEFDPTTMEWDAMRARFVYKSTAPTHKAPVVVPTAPVRKAKMPRDPLAARLADLDRAGLIAYAKQHGVYKSEYEALPNPGLLRMSIGNRLRAKVRRGELVP